jgi:hypothetical protein
MVGFLTAREVGAILRVADVTLRMWRKTCRGPEWIKAGGKGKVLYNAKSLALWLRPRVKTARESS